jgi:hypothetical protein
MRWSEKNKESGHARENNYEGRSIEKEEKTTTTTMTTEERENDRISCHWIHFLHVCLQGLSLVFIGVVLVRDKNTFELEVTIDKCAEHAR